MSRLTINSNIPSLNAQRNLGNASRSLETSFTRLSSGLRINKASDDAAGLSVASLITIDRRVINQGIRNLNDGVSYLNIAESALNELSNIVTRISELAEQAANGTLGSKQREALQQEVTSLQSEYNRIIRTTTFNGNQLLTGSTTNTILQGGYGYDAQLEVQVGIESLGISTDLTRAGLTTRIDTSSAGTIGNGITSGSVISADGRYIAFTSASSNLVSGDGNTVDDVFIKDTVTGETKRVSTDSSGNQANGSSTVTAISADGRYVGFNSNASNLVGGDTNGLQDSFLKDTLTGITIRVSTDSNGVEANSSSAVDSISADGRYVVFTTGANNLVSGDSNGASDVFVKDTLTNNTKRISTDANNNQVFGTSSAGFISADGRYVAFRSTAPNLIDGYTTISPDIFLKDLITNEIKLVSVNTDGTQNNGGITYHTGISADGRYIIFDSNATTLVSGDTNGVQDVFIRDTWSNTTTRVSTDSSGAQAGNSSYGLGVSADGRYVYLASYQNLSTDSLDGFIDVYVKDTFTNETRIVGTNSEGAKFGGHVGTATTNGGISGNGRYVIFTDHTGASYIRDLSKSGIQEISGMVVSNQVSAKITLDLSKKYQEELSSYRAGIGASLSRASTFINTLQVQSENYAAAASQITDIDVAEESSKLAANQILQRAAASVLAQANQQPRLVLKLLSEL